MLPQWIIDGVLLYLKTCQEYGWQHTIIIHVTGELFGKDYNVHLFKDDVLEKHDIKRFVQYILAEIYFS